MYTSQYSFAPSGFQAKESLFRQISEIKSDINSFLSDDSLVKLEEFEKKEENEKRLMEALKTVKRQEEQILHLENVLTKEQDGMAETPAKRMRSSSNSREHAIKFTDELQEERLRSHSLEGEILTLKHELERNKLEHAGLLRKSEHHFVQEKQKLEEIIRSQNREIAHLKRSVENLEQAKENCANSQQSVSGAADLEELEKMRAECACLNDRLQAASSQHDADRDLIHDLTKELNAQKRECSGRQETIRELEANVEYYQTVAAQSRKECEQLRSELATLSLSPPHDGGATVLRSPGAATLAHLRQEAARVRSLEKTITELEDENRELRHSRQNSDLLREQLQSQRTTEDDTAALTRQLQKANETIADFQQKTTHLNAYLADVAPDGFTSATDVAAKMSELQRKCCVLTEKEGELGATVSLLRSQLRALEEEHESVVGKATRLAGEVKMHKSGAMRQEKRALYLQRQLETLKKIMESYEDEELKNATHKVTPDQEGKEVGVRNGILIRSLESAQERIKTLEEEIEILESSRRESTNALSTQEAVCNTLRFQIATLQGELEVSRREVRTARVCTEDVRNSSLLPPPNNSDTAGPVDGSDTAAGDLKRLNEDLEATRTENARLKKEIAELETEVVALENRLGKGEYDPKKTKVVHLSFNPEAVAVEKQRKTREELMAVNKQLTEETAELKAQLANAVAAGNNSGSSTQIVDELKAELAQAQELKGKCLILQQQLSDSEKRSLRLKEIFKAKIQEFREACYQLNGYRIDFVGSQYRLRSMYAEREADCIVFQSNEGSMSLMETEFTASLPPEQLVLLTKCHSIPAFLASITNELFSRQTFFA